MNQLFSCSDKETLLAYVYGECDGSDRARVEAHLPLCAACTEEVAGLGGVRTALAAWVPPAEAGGFRIVRDEEPQAPATVLRPARWWARPMPTWARAAAAVLLFAGGAGLANLDVRYGADGLTIRTGWNHPTAAPVVAAVQPPAASSSSAPWRNDLVALERQLRGDFAAQVQARPAAQAVSSSPPADERQIMARVQTMLNQSEQRWQRELANRVVQVQGEFGVQRRTDQARITQALSQMQGQTGAEIAQQRQYINYLLNTVSLKK
jgi:anti-sigma factor RsiW